MTAHVEPFEAICFRGSSGRWCWRIFCTTCGHAQFKYAFMQLSAGIYPGSPNWVWPGNLKLAHQKLGPLPVVWRPSLEGQRLISEALSSAELSRIARRCGYPAWLGYLGLGLFYSFEHESASGILTKLWVPQLLSLLPADASSRSYFEQMLHGEGVLYWADLEKVERDLDKTTHTQH